MARIFCAGCGVELFFGEVGKESFCADCTKPKQGVSVMPLDLQTLRTTLAKAFDTGRDAVFDVASVNKSEFSTCREYDEREDTQAAEREAAIDAGRQAANDLLDAAARLQRIEALREQIEAQYDRFSPLSLVWQPDDRNLSMLLTELLAALRPSETETT